MKRFFLVVLAVYFSALSLSAQPDFGAGDKLVGFSIGLGGYYGDNIYSSVNRLPLIALYYEQCFIGELFDENSSLGFGGMVGYTQAKWKNNWKTSTTIIGFRAALHYSFVDNLDCYAGLMIGYNIYKHTFYNNFSGVGPDKNNEIIPAGFIGARYYFKRDLAVFAELGYGASNLNIGLAKKF